MPLYEYRCPHCGDFTHLAPMHAAKEPAVCDECGASAPRILSPPRLAQLSTVQRTAFERNERSAHAPRRSTGHVCHDGCRHNAAPAPQRPKRPWMLGH